MSIRYTILETAWGYAGFVVSEQGLCRTQLPQTDIGAIESDFLESYPNATYHKNLHPDLSQQIQDYFNGGHQTFTDTPLDLDHPTPFSRAVYQACRKIPSGQTRTYGQLAQTAGRPKAARAVGGVMAKNPIPLIIPCHRVVGRNGNLTGFSAPGGTDLKKRMLELETQALSTT